MHTKVVAGACPARRTLTRAIRRRRSSPVTQSNSPASLRPLLRGDYFRRGQYLLGVLRNHRVREKSLGQTHLLIAPLAQLVPTTQRRGRDRIPHTLRG